MTRNTQSNNWIKRLVIIGDFMLLNLILYVFAHSHPTMTAWHWYRLHAYLLVVNFALLLSEWHGHTIIHQRLVSSGDVLKRVIQLSIALTLLTYLVLRAIDFRAPVGYLLIEQGCAFLVGMLLVRFVERFVIKYYRHAGGNIRKFTLVGDDPELENVKHKLMMNPALGYQVLNEFKSLSEFVAAINGEQKPELGDELYLCAPHREKDLIKRISRLCDQQLVGFFYVPVSVEVLGISLKREMLDDIDIYTTYAQPSQTTYNQMLKRFCDVVLSLIFLIPTALIFPIVWLCVKIQSPGPVIFKQLRTGLDGKSFTLYKFRSMHVNNAADVQQATKDDPRKFPFGNILRKLSIDELPQLWNVLKGDMSIVGPRPHMLAHTNEYSNLIDKYMVRHFVKPGITGWAQVTGCRGETKELWQMEERVKRDIWYMENWSIWLDIRIFLMTFKNMFYRDKCAY